MNIHVHRVACTVGFVLFMGAPFAQGESLSPLRLAPDELTWMPAPTGAYGAFLVGHPTKPGLYVIRGKFPPNFRVEPHFHPDERISTVLSGTLYVGYGEQFDESKMRPLPRGSIWTEPAKQPHFVWAKDGEVIIQVIGNGPSAVIPVQPKQRKVKTNIAT